MSTKTVTKPNSLHDYTIHPDAGDTVTFTRSRHNITSLPVPWIRIDAYESVGGPLVITWLTPEHYKQANKSLRAKYDSQEYGSRGYKLPQSWYGERFRQPGEDCLIPVSMIPLELMIITVDKIAVNLEP